MAKKTLQSLPHSARVTRANRGRLTFLGLVLLIGSLAGLAVSYGLIGKRIRHQPIFGSRVHDLAAHDWFWIIVAVAALVVVVESLRWLVHQVGSDRVGDVQIESDRAHGSTVLSSSAVTSAVAEEVESYRGVDRASAHLRGSTSAPTLVVRATLDDDADLAAIRDQVVAGAVTHARRVLDDPDLPARVEFRLGGHDTPGPR